MKRFALAVGACALVMTAAACKSGADSVSAPQPGTSQLTSDDTLEAVAYSVGQATVADLSVFGTSGTMLGFDASSAAAAFSISPASRSNALGGGCTFDSGTGRFDCPPVTTDGLTLVRSFAFFDASGSPMMKFDSTTASANIMATETGVRPSLTGADTVNRNRNVTVSGLLGHNTTRIWNGSGVRSDGGYWSDRLALRTYDVQDNTTFTNIVVTLPRLLHLWPTSGSVSRSVRVTGSVNRGGVIKTFTVSKDITVTFNGTEQVPMTIGGVSYTLDLLTGQATRN